MKTLILNQLRTGTPMKYSKGCLIAVVAMTTVVASAATFSPVSVSGYNTDIVFEKTAGTSTVNGTFGSRNMFEDGALDGIVSGYPNPNYPNAGAGLATGGTYSLTVGSDDLTFQLAPYTVDQVNIFSYSTSGDTSGTLTLDTPAQYSEIALAYANASITSGRNAATFDAVVNYTDSTSDTFAIPQLDWGMTTPSVFPNFDIAKVGRIKDNSPTGTLGSEDTSTGSDTTNRWGFYGIILNVNSSKTIESVTLDAGAAGSSGGQAAFWAVSGVAAVPEPTVAALGGLGMLLLIGVQRSRRRA